MARARADLPKFERRAPRRYPGMPTWRPTNRLGVERGCHLRLEMGTRPASGPLARQECLWTGPRLPKTCLEPKIITERSAVAGRPQLITSEAGGSRVLRSAIFPWPEELGLGRTGPWPGLGQAGQSDAVPNVAIASRMQIAVAQSGAAG